MAPKRSQTPFKLAQLFVLAILLLLGVFAARKCTSEQIHPAWSKGSVLADGFEDLLHT
jgi:hypothetical protein